MVLKWYRKLVDKYPFRAPILTAGTITTVADILAQTITKEKHETYNWKRTQVMTTIGLCYFGPINTLWFRFLHKKKWSPLRCLVADQTLTGPLLAAGFCFLHPLLSGKSKEDAVDHLINKYPSVITAAWCLWTPSQAINFLFIPFQFRVLFTQTVSLIWNTFLSFVSNKSALY